MTDYVLIQDQIGRPIFGKVANETDTTLTIASPIIISFEPDPQGRGLSLSIYPLIFFEVLDENSRDKNNWTYQKSSIVVSDAVLKKDLIERYELVNTPKPEQPQKEDNPKVISFDDL